MNLAYLSNGPDRKPALVLSQVTPDAARRFRDAVEPLMAGISRRMPFHEIAGLTNAAGLTLAGVPGKAVGVQATGAAEFVWEETLSGWLRVYDLLEPFAMPAAGAALPPAQLQSAGEIAVVVTIAAD